MTQDEQSGFDEQAAEQALAYAMEQAAEPPPEPPAPPKPPRKPLTLPRLPRLPRLPAVKVKPRDVLAVLVLICKKTVYFTKAAFNREAVYGLALRLLLITSLTALLLGLANRYTSGYIRSAEEEEMAALMRAILPAEQYEPVESASGRAYTALVGGEVAGYAAVAESPGFAGPIKLLVGFTDDFTIAGVRIISMLETAGYGTRAESEPWFLAQFEGKAGGLQYGRDIDALSGATVSSAAILEAVNNARELIWSLREAGAI
jgi:electron transport complex protein RnfG